MEQLLQALKKALPSEHLAEVSKAVERIVNDKVAEVEDRCAAKLESAYEQLAAEKKHDEDICEAGYRQAYAHIASLMQRIDEQNEQFETAMESGFREAYDKIEAAKKGNNNVELKIYEEFDNKLKKMKEIMIDKVDEFLAIQESEMEEKAIRAVLNNPRILEQRVAVEKMADILSDYMSNDEISGLSSAKLEETNRNIENFKAQLRIVEAKNVNLARVNNKLNEQVREAKSLIVEATKVERKERSESRGRVSGRGQRVVSEQILSEYAAPTNKPSNDRALSEAHDPLNDILVLAGLEQS